MITLEEFVRSAEFGSIGGGSSYSSVVSEFGEPEAVEPERKSYPKLALYGDIEFRFHADALTGISVRLKDEHPPSALGIDVQGFWPASTRTLDAVRTLLESSGVSWRADPIMSDINPEESSQVWITEQNIHLGFFEGRLQVITADYLKPTS